MHWPNVLTGSRILLAPFVYYAGFVREKELFVLLFVLGGLTDAADGFLARLHRKTSLWGSRLDTIADLVFYPAGLMLYFFVPQAVTDNLIFILPIIGIFLLSVLIDVFRRRFGMPHLLSAKLTGIVIYAFVVYTVLVDYVPVFFYITAIIGAWAAVDQLRSSLRVKA